MPTAAGADAPSRPRPAVPTQLLATARARFARRARAGWARGAFASPAVSTVAIPDAVGDAGDTRGDITATAASVKGGILAFAIAVAAATDPATDPNWMSQSTAILFGIETTNDDTPEFIAVIVSNGAGGLGAGIFDKNNKLVCRGIAQYGSVHGTYAAAFSKGCPASVYTFRWAAVMLYDFDSNDVNSPSIDGAPDTGWARSLALREHPQRNGYWMLGSDGSLYAFGDAPKFTAKVPNATAMATCRDGKGVLVVNAAGGVFAFGSARWDGGYPLLGPQEKITAISANPACNGYWLFSNRGRAFAMGVAFYGDMSHVVLNGPVVASVATPSGRGYYMLGTDGGIFGFGDARFHGSMAHAHLNKPIVGMAPTPDNSGYWEVGSDGGVFGFHAPFRGAMGGVRLNRPINGIVAFGNGYLMVASDGGVFGFSNQHFLGSLAAHPPTAPIIGIAAFTT